jgi:NH3-dependent NAD+ synthetase
MNIKNFLPIIEKVENCVPCAIHIRAHLKSYIQENRLQSLVLGISGGIDSALCATLLRSVCEA